MTTRSCGTCCICGVPMRYFGTHVSHTKKAGYYGNNPYPLKQGRNDRCCDDCNALYVLPARMGVNVQLPKLRRTRNS